VLGDVIAAVDALSLDFAETVFVTDSLQSRVSYVRTTGDGVAVEDAFFLSGFGLVMNGADDGASAGPIVMYSID
jgi:hypothetical protein